VAVRASFAWYVRRARAMSGRELVWRAAAPVRSRLAPPPLRPPDWTTPRWTALLGELAPTAPADTVETAGRIADGERSLWGRPPRGDEVDPKERWELERQQHLVPLALGAAVAGRPDWARLCVDELLRFAASPRPATSGYEASHRLIGWAWAVPLVAAEATAAELARIGAAYAEDRRLVERTPSRYSSANNHRLAELVGLLGAATLDGGAGFATLWSELEDEVALQTYPDGGSREQASGYFLYVLELLWLAGLFARASAAPLGRLAERLEAMLCWLYETARDDGEPPAFGDDAEDRGLRIDYFAPRSAAAIAGRVRSLLDGQPSLSRMRTEHATGSAVLPSGYAVLRSGPVRIVFDVGELGYGSIAAHGHADALSVLVDVGNDVLVRDSGTGSYVEVRGRDDYRTTAAHNTVVVNGRPQADPLGPHLWGRRFHTTVEASSLTPELDYVRASHDGYRPDAEHTRSVLFAKPDLLLVLDRVAGSGSVDAELTWHVLAGGVPLAVTTVPDADPVEGPAPFSPRYDRREVAVAYRWHARGGVVVFATAIAFAGGAPALALELGAGGEASVHVLRPRPLAVVESWRSPAPTVHAHTVN
jgi:hypothetical protein